ncbi:peptidase [Klebsiella spallanzanii]|uniref:peptidase n=1 Tax=Klebsiella spallanzanii TaxID=2587528 RepID=UPI0025994DEE|nr:peptidase [Klebsiella spallanzanii]MDM4209455.1 peptidase [Klebsiella spallanzanii]
MKRIAVILLASCCCSPLQAHDVLLVSHCVPGSLLHKHRLEKTHMVDDFHIYYSLQGKDALQYPQDSTGDGVPDVIKDIASQLQAAEYLYTSLLGLRTPLRQKIYAQARQINIYLLTLPKGNGLAFDRVAAETMSDRTALPCGLKIVLNAALQPARNVTPAHELFHLYQYGYAVFKQKWYLEGMARWMENVFRPAEKRVLPPAEPSTCERNFSRGYGAASFWAGYAQHGFPAITLPDKAMAWRYADGSPVFKTRELPGGKMLQPFFQQLALSSESISREMNLANTRWSEKQQRAGQFNSLICQALADTAIR